MMNTSYKSHDPEKRYFILSFFMHVIVFFLFYFFHQFSLNLSSDDNLNVDNEKRVKLIRVDVVTMPKMTIQELRKRQQLSTSRGVQNAKINEKKEVVAKQNDEELDDLFSDLASKKVKLKKSDTIQKVKKKTERKGDEFSQSELDELIYEGNKISEGSSLEGSLSQEELSEFEKYKESLPRFIRPHWSLPSYLARKGLVMRIQIGLDNKGKILFKKIIQSSGVEEFDKRAILSLEKASLPAPKKELVPYARSGKIILGFPL